MATATILDDLDNTVNWIKPIDYSTIKISEPRNAAVLKSVLPFRVRFTAITIEGYTSTNVPPIPLQVIGYSNYIL